MDFYGVFGGDVALAIVRLAIASGAGWTLYTMSRMLRRGPTHRKIALVPRSIIWFTVFWSASTLVTSLLLLVLDAGAVTGALRTWYGVTLGWQVFGMAWVLAIGSSGSLSALEAMDKIHSIVESDSKGGDDS